MGPLPDSHTLLGIRFTPNGSNASTPAGSPAADSPDFQQGKEQQNVPARLAYLLPQLGQKKCSSSSPASAADALASAQALRQQALSNLGLQGLASVMKKVAGGSGSSPGLGDSPLPGSSSEQKASARLQEKLAPGAVALQQLPQQQQQQQPGSGGKDTFSSFYSAMGDSIKKRFQQDKESAAAAAAAAGAAAAAADEEAVGPAAVKKPKLSLSKPAAAPAAAAAGAGASASPAVGASTAAAAGPAAAAADAPRQQQQQQQASPVDLDDPIVVSQEPPPAGVTMLGGSAAAAQYSKGKLSRDTTQPDKLKPVKKVLKKSSGDGGRGQSSISSFFGKQAQQVQAKAGADALKGHGSGGSGGSQAQAGAAGATKDQGCEVVDLVDSE